MERWAKAQNKRNDSKGNSSEPAGCGLGEGQSGSGAADAAFAVLLERRDRPNVDKSSTFQMHMKKEAPVSTIVFFIKLCMKIFFRFF